MPEDSLSLVGRLGKQQRGGRARPRARSVSEKHGHERAMRVGSICRSTDMPPRVVQAYAVHSSTDMQSNNELLLRASSASEKHGHPRTMQAYTVVHVNYGYAIKQLATLTSEQRERERHGHLRAVQACTVVRDILRICNQATSYSYERAA